MRRRWFFIVSTLVVAGMGVGVSLAWQEKGAVGGAVYQVTDWPPASDTRPYREFLQEYLNEMASKGWRLDQALVSATSARMLVFRRDG